MIFNVKKFIIFGACALFPLQTSAAELTLFANGNMTLKVDGGGVAIFDYEGETYVITEDEGLQVSKEKSIPYAPVQVKGGTGIRFKLTNPPARRLTFADGGYKMLLDDTTTAVTDDSGWSVLASKNQLHLDSTLKEVSLPSGQKLLVATSPRVKPWREQQILARMIVYPTYSGFAASLNENVKISAFTNGGVRLTGGQLTQGTARQKPIEISESKEATPPVNEEFIAESPPKKRPQVADAAMKERAFDQLWTAITAVENIPLPGEREEAERAEEQARAEAAETEKERMSRNFLPKPTRDMTFIERRNALFREFTEALDDAEKDGVRLEIAKLMLIYSRPTEALAVLKAMRKNIDTNLPAYPLARLYYGVAQTQLGNAAEALPIFKEDILPEDHRLLWQGMAEEQLGRSSKGFSLIQDNIQAIKNYPPNIWTEVRIAEARSLLAKKEYQRVLDALEDMDHLLNPQHHTYDLRYARAESEASDDEEDIEIEPDIDIFDRPNTLPPEAQLLMARALLGMQDFEGALIFFASAAESKKPEVAFQAQYDYVSLLYDRREIERTQLIGYLEDLRTLWRGNDLEKTILYELGQLYIEEKEFRKGLERLKTFTIYYPDTENQEKINEQLTKTFLKALNRKNIDQFDDLGVLGFYYDFRELTPPGETGDKLINEIGERLLKMGLVKRTIRLLTNQMTYRTKNPVKKAQMALYLAELYEDAGDYMGGLDVLSETEHPSIPADLKQKRAAAKAHLYVGLEKYNDGFQAVKGLEGREASMARVDVAWAEKDYKLLVKLLAEDFREMTPSDKWDARKKRDFLAYAYGYNQLGDLEMLESIRDKFALQIFESKMGTVIDLLIQDLKGNPGALSVAGGNERLNKVVQQLASLNAFSTSYTVLRDARLKERYDRLRRQGRLPPPKLN